MELEDNGVLYFRVSFGQRFFRGFVLVEERVEAERRCQGGTKG